jgi:DNA primase
MDQVHQIREKIDIVSFISEYIPVKKAGRNFQALCPFHGEKTPSFVISPERQIWHCFGCQKGGDCYTFLMEYEHLEFPEALRFLAKQTGVQLTSESYADTTISAKKENLYKVNSLAAEFYHYILQHHPAGKTALDYLTKRGINEKLIKTFKIGFAPVSGRDLTRYFLQKKQYRKEDLLDAGLVSAYSNGLADFFRGRIIFPLIDQRDNILGFSGRILDEKNAFGGKYINTRDTLIYHKREHFFGLNITKENIRKSNQAILVEGEFDVMSCFQNGISNVLAVKGTALTEQQVVLLNRYAHKVTICFDGDSAGQEAIKRSLPLLAKRNLQITVVEITSGKDPDEALKTNPVEFKKSIKHDIDVYEYLFTQIIQQFSPAASEGKKNIANTLLPIINDIDNAIVKEHYLRKLSSVIQTSYDSVILELEKLNKKSSSIEKTVMSIAQRPREEVMEEYLLALILQSADPYKMFKTVWEALAEHLPNKRAYQKFLYYLADFLEQKGKYDQAVFNNSLPAELLNTFNNVLLLPLSSFSDISKYITEMEKIANQLKTIYIKEKVKHLAELIKLKEAEGKEEEATVLKEDYARMVALLK